MAKRVLNSTETGTGDLVDDASTTGTATPGTDPTTETETGNLLEGGASELVKAKEGAGEDSSIDI